MSEDPASSERLPSAEELAALEELTALGREMNPEGYGLPETMFRSKGIDLSDDEPMEEVTTVPYVEEDDEPLRKVKFVPVEDNDEW